MKFIKKLLTTFLILSFLFSPCAYAKRWTQKPPLGSQIDYGHPLSRGLVFCALMNEGGGSKVYNLATPGVYNGLLNGGITYSPSRNGTGLRFNGTTGTYIDCGSGFNFTSQPFTISFWIKYTSIAANGQIIVYKGDYQTNGYYAQISNVYGISFQTNQSGAVQSSTTANGVFSLGQWINIAFVRKGSSVRIYVNGVDKTNTAASHINPTSSSRNFQIGRYQGDTNQYYLTGNLDNYLILNRALSPFEIRKLSEDPYCFIRQNNYGILKGGVQAGVVDDSQVIFVN